ncbi:MAG: hypothetical protein PF904_02360 [Kiritimatiellae bacterium]|jgi:quercetin dioxygenase-like cupin family protein|nr:hypothetical protein [Kiritimatiellia bacterium]
MFNSCTYIGGGRFYFRTGQRFKKRTIKHHRLIFIAQGSGSFSFPDISMPVKAGDFYLLAPGPREAHYNKVKAVSYEYIEFDSVIGVRH